jgi:membrane fusion protein, multidrug efflux system
MENSTVESLGHGGVRDGPAHSSLGPLIAGAREHIKRHPWRFILGGAAVVLAVLGLWLLLSDLLKPAPAPIVPAIPVVAALAQKADVPVYLTGIGTVQAYNTVTVHVQVNGTLSKVLFVEGQDVKAGDLLAQIDPRPLQAQLDEVVAAKARDEALLANARLDLSRYQALYIAKAVSQQVLATQAALVAQDAATVQNDSAQIEYAKVQLGFTAITSPISGRTGVRMIDAGNIVQTTDTTGLVVVTQLQPISVLFTLPEDDFEAVNRQIAAGTLSVAASNRADGKILDRGTVLLINNEIDTTTGTVELKATFPNKNHTLWPGQFVDARLLLETHHGAVTIPSAAVQRGPDGIYAYVVKPNKTVEMRTITVSASNDGGPTAQIKSGIAAGEQVVLDGQLTLHPGAHVKVVTAAPSPK